MLELIHSNIIFSLSVLTAASFILILFRLRGSRKKLEEQNAKDREENLQQQKLLNAIIRAQEGERSRIATDLHDSVGSELAMLKLNLSKIAFFLAKKEVDIGPLLEELQQLDEAIDHLSDICRDLYPVALKQYGFIKTFEELICKINKRTGLDCRYRFNLKESDLFADDENKLNLLRLFQEILTNLLKYADCTVLDIGFMKYSNGIKIILKHDGRPFDNAEVSQMLAHGKGVGLVSTYNRLLLMRGQINYTRVPSGSEILIELPLING
jgi:signal transduction histidine kinase